MKGDTQRKTIFNQHRSAAREKLFFEMCHFHVSRGYSNLYPFQNVRTNSTIVTSSRTSAMTPLLTQIVSIISRESRRFARQLAASVVGLQGSQQTSLQPEGQQTSLQQEGQQTSLQPVGQQTSLQQEGQQTSLQPDIQQTSLQQENLVILPTPILIPL